MASTLIHARKGHANSPLSPRFKAELLCHLSSTRAPRHNLIHQGFTLVELMVVTVIVGILAAIAIPNFIAQTEKAKITEGKQTIAAVLKQGHADYQEDPKIIAAGASSASILCLYKAPGYNPATCAATTNPTKFDYAVTTQPAADGSTTVFAITATPNANFGKASVAGAKIVGCVNLVSGVVDVMKNFSQTTIPTCPN